MSRGNNLSQYSAFNREKSILESFKENEETASLAALPPLYNIKVAMNDGAKFKNTFPQLCESIVCALPYVYGYAFPHGEVCVGVSIHQITIQLLWATSNPFIWEDKTYVSTNPALRHPHPSACEFCSLLPRLCKPTLNSKRILLICNGVSAIHTRRQPPSTSEICCRLIHFASHWADKLAISTAWADLHWRVGIEVSRPHRTECRATLSSSAGLFLISGDEHSRRSFLLSYPIYHTFVAISFLDTAHVTWNMTIFFIFPYLFCSSHILANFKLEYHDCMKSDYNYTLSKWITHLFSKKKWSTILRSKKASKSSKICINLL